MDEVTENIKYKKYVKITFWMFAAICLVWPIASFMVIFVFDSPIKGTWDLIFRYYMAFSIWLYPLFVLASYLSGRFSIKNKRNAILTSLIPMLSFLPWLVLIFTVDNLFSILLIW